VTERRAGARSITLPAHAKINLFLEILGRRADGYHELWTLFQEISLHDTLTVRRTAAPGLRLTCSQADLAGPDNLAARAARLVLPSAEGGGLDLRLTKRIPVGAGLGGGSSDGAAALRAAWALSRRRPVDAFPAASYRRDAATLGADVPFFLRGGLAEGRGIGDRLRPLTVRRENPLWFVLVFPRVFSSTPAAYKSLRRPLKNLRSGLRLRRILEDGGPVRLWAPLLFNRLEEAVVPRLPAVAEAQRALVQAGCATARMSGSGSSVFGVVETPAQGRRVLGRLRGEPWDMWLVRSRDPESSTDRRGAVHGNHRDSRDVAK
jgi:4-diphosphocytidyl-2-C-methyl-D-erythritol kinase